MKRVFSFTCLVLLIITNLAIAADSISPEDAKNQIGKQATVCGNVAGTHFANRAKGLPTYIYFGHPYPKQVFMALIWGDDRRSYPESPDRYYRDKKICVSGKVEQFNGTPTIIVKNPHQIREEK